MIDRQVRLADSIVYPLTRRGGHYCFYRSVILATLLREQGVPVLVNMGGRNLTSARMKAHSWLTLDGRLFHERTDREETTRYCFDMGQNADGTVRYWIGRTFDDMLLNDQTTAVRKRPEIDRREESTEWT